LGVASWASAIEAREGASRWLVKNAATAWGIMVVVGLCVLGYNVTRGDITDRHNAWPNQLAFVRQVSLAPHADLWAGKNALETASFAPHPVTDLFALDAFKRIMPWRIQIHSAIATQRQAANPGLWKVVTNPESEPSWQLQGGATANTWSSHPVVAERGTSRLPIRGDWRSSKLKLTLISADDRRIVLGTGDAIHTDWFFVQIPSDKGDRYHLEVTTTAEHSAAEMSPIRSVGRLSSIYEPVLNILENLFRGRVS
jgi:hypothetical protein